MTPSVPCPMRCLRTDLIDTLRSMARRGQQPSAMLRAIVAELGPEAADRPLLVRYFSAAFCFADGQGYKIFGWFPDGSGALKDSAIDGLLFGRIQETRSEWDQPDQDRTECSVGECDNPPALPTISIQEAQAKLADLIHRLAPGDEIVLTENDQPVARLLPAQAQHGRKVRRLGTLRGR